MTTSHNPTSYAALQPRGDTILPDELLVASHRLATSRARNARTLTRSRGRRRIIPSIVVTSIALVGAGLANAFVNSTIVPPSSAATTAATAAASNAARQTAANTVTLARLSAVLAADRRTLAALAASAVQTRAAAATATARFSTASTAAPSISRAGVVGLPGVPAPPVVAAPAPVTHAMTGASGAG